MAILSKKDINYLYKNYRFELFLFVQLGILFGALFIPPVLYEKLYMPILYQISLLAGIFICMKRKRRKNILLSFFSISSLALVMDGFDFMDSITLRYILMACFFVSTLITTIEIIQQVWQTEWVDDNVVFGLLSGYLSLGFIGFFIFLSINIYHPGSFTGVQIATIADDLLYFSFVTLLTIGYGDIHPVGPLAQKACILIGLSGQFYMLVITAVVLEKYIRHRGKRRDEF